MNESKLSDYSLIIKHQLTSQEILFEYNSKIEAMLEMVLANEGTDFPKEKLYYYFWVISDIVSKAKELNIELIDILASTMALLLVIPQTSA